MGSSVAFEADGVISAVETSDDTGVAALLGIIMVEFGLALTLAIHIRSGAEILALVTLIANVLLSTCQAALRAAEAMLNGMGFYHWDQVAKWGGDEVAWVDQNLEGFKGRVSRDNWVDQAQKLAAGEQTEFSAKARKDGRYD